MLLVRLADVAEQLRKAQCEKRLPLPLVLEPLAFRSNLRLKQSDLVDEPFLSHCCPPLNASPRAIRRKDVSLPAPWDGHREGHG